MKCKQTKRECIVQFMIHVRDAYLHTYNQPHTHTHSLTTTNVHTNKQ